MKLTKKALAQFEQKKKLLLKPCKTKAELHKYILYFFGLFLPDTTVSRYADTNPLDMIWKVYDICVNKHNPDNIEEILYVAGRGSGKTLGMAIVELMIMLHDQRDVCHVGAVMAQAKRCYEYQVKFMLNQKIKPLMNPKHLHVDDRILQKMNMEKSIFLIDDQHISIEVLPCTMKALNGPHVPLVVVDEIDTVSGEGLKAIKEVNGMLDSRNGKKAIKVGISTRKSRYGLMNRQIENAEAEGRTVFKWTAFEFTDRCPDSRSGTTKTDAYILQDEMEVLDQKTFDLKDIKRQREYTKYEMPGSKCLKCPAAAICLGDAKNQTSKSPMLKPISELIQKVRSEGSDWALAQLMNLKPSIEGIVYKEFAEKIHVKKWNQMWKLLTGTEFPGECTHDIFVKKCHALQLSCYAGIDWGWSSPNTVVYAFIDKRENIYIVRADGMTHISSSEWINYIKHKYHHKYRCQLYFPDIQEQGAIVEMRKAGLPAASENDKNINSGIQIVKKFLRVPGSTDPKIFIAGETCEPLIHEFMMYHFKLDAAGLVTEMPESRDDHWLDALRYMMMMLFGKTRFMMGTDGAGGERQVTTADGQYYRTPTPEEFAYAQGIDFTVTEEHKRKLGKIGTPNEMEDEDDELGGEGGFLWSL